MPKRAGFTLVELLTVVSIVAVLTAILLPVVGRARAAAARVACVGNMRQIGNAMLIYLADSDGVMPSRTDMVDDFMSPAAPTSYYREVVGPYLSGDTRVLRCRTAQPDRAWAPTAISEASYAANAVVLGRKLTLVRAATSLVCVQEMRVSARIGILRPASSNDHPGAAPPGKYLYWHYRDPAEGFVENYSNSHDRGGNLLFCDGHAEYRKLDDLPAAISGCCPPTSTPTRTTCTRTTASSSRPRRPSRPQTLRGTVVKNASTAPHTRRVRNVVAVARRRFAWAGGVVLWVAGNAALGDGAAHGGGRTAPPGERACSARTSTRPGGRSSACTTA